MTNTHDASGTAKTTLDLAVNMLQKVKDDHKGKTITFFPSVKLKLQKNKSKDRINYPEARRG